MLAVTADGSLAMERDDAMSYEEKEEHESYVDPDNPSDEATTSATHANDDFSSPRPSWELERERSRPTSVRSIPLSMHSSAITNLSVLRSRTRATRTFTHPLGHERTKPDVIVCFDGPDDPYRPLNWPFKKKVIAVLLYGLTTMGITFASSVYSAGVKQIAEEFHVGTQVSTLGITLMLFGFGLGPLVWAPLSELYGRKPAVLTPYFIAAIFSFATAVSKDLQTVMITRFFAGLFGSAPITNTGGVLGDLFTPEQRGLAIIGYSLAVIGGPSLGPIVGGAICQSYLGWRWTEYVTGIFMMSILTLDVLFIDESYAPVLLVYKAQRLRHETGNWALHAKHEEWDVSITEMAKKYGIRPFQMLSTPICLLVALYASFIYGILYANLGAFPYVFQEVRGWGQVVGALPFLALLVGIIIGAGFNALNQKYYIKRLRANNNRPVPEARLPPMMFGSLVFTMGLFIFAWTSQPTTNYWASLVGIILMGAGFLPIFQGAINYLIDTFQRYSASAVAANTFLRSCFAGAFPLFITPMLHNIGVDWGITIFACVSVLCLPIPYLFFIYGKRIRARGYWSKESI